MYAQTADDIECPDAWLFCRKRYHRKRYPNGLIWVFVFLPDGVKNTVTYAVATSAKSSYSILCLLLLSFSKNPFLGTVFNLLANLYARITNLKKGPRQQKTDDKMSSVFCFTICNSFSLFPSRPVPHHPTSSHLSHHSYIFISLGFNYTFLLLQEDLDVKREDSAF